MVSAIRIAFDIDDVIADTTEAMRVYVNQRTGANLTFDDYRVPATYWGYYEHVWAKAGIHSAELSKDFHARMGVAQDNITPVEGAADTLHRIVASGKYKVYAVTSRELFMESETRRWVDRYYQGIFEDIVLLGHVRTARQTKGEACREIGASKLFDDNIGHCLSAVECGVSPVLYGEYGWHHEFQGGMPRCKSMKDVARYLDV
jgi:hypothetical protein